MKTETYKGRRLKVVKGRGRDWGYTRVTLNGADLGTHMGDENSTLRWLRGSIDHVDETGMGSGRYGAEWYAPGTYALNEAEHVVVPGGTCSCGYCESRPWESCQNITVGGTCVCVYCMKPYL